MACVLGADRASVAVDYVLVGLVGPVVQIGLRLRYEHFVFGEVLVSDLDGQPIGQIKQACLADVLELGAGLADDGSLEATLRARFPPEDRVGPLANFALVPEFVLHLMKGSEREGRQQRAARRGQLAHHHTLMHDSSHTSARTAMHTLMHDASHHQTHAGAKANYHFQVGVVSQAGLADAWEL